MRGYFAALLSALLLTLTTATIVLAQVPGVPTSSASTATAVPELPDPLSPEAIRELVSRLSDDEVRLMLLEQLDAVAEASAQDGDPPATLFDTLTEIGIAFAAPVLGSVQALPALFTSQATVIGNFAAAFGGSGLLVLAGLLIGVLAIGYAAELLVTRVLFKPRPADLHPEADTLAANLGFLGRRLARELFGLIVFYVVIRIIGTAVLTDAQAMILAPLVRGLILTPRLIASVSRFLLAPRQPQMRLLSVSDHWAKYLHRNLIGLGILGGFTLFIGSFNTQYGANLSNTWLAYWLNTALHLYIASIAWTAREGLTDMMRGTDPDRTKYDEFTARMYPFFAIAVSLLTWALANVVIGFGNVELLRQGAHYTTMFWLLMAPLIDTAIRGLVRHLQPPMIGEGPVAEAAHKSNKRSMIRIGRVLAFGMIVMIIAGTWDINLSDVGSASARFAGNLIEFLVIGAVGYMLYELVSLWINRRLTKETTAAQTSDQEAGEGGGAGGSRLATVLPLIRITAQVAISTIFALLAIGSLGIDITPLLAGAGILGLAIGFGAQKLVSDIVSGIFFLIDDAFRVGEYVDVGGTMGSVERISIRSMQLRHHRGNVHTIPYGSIEKVTNFSRDWVIMKLMFTVPFDTDPNKVKKIFKRIGAEMMEDPLFKDDFLEPFKSQGVFQFDDVGIVMRGKFMAKPGTQFTIRKEIYNRVRKEFEANGIEFARREVRVAIPGMDEQHEELTPEQQQAMSAGVGGAVQAQIEEQAAQAEKK